MPRISAASLTRCVDLLLFELPHLEAERHVVEHAHVRVERVVLEHHGDVAIHGGEIIDDMSVDRNVPRN